MPVRVRLTAWYAAMLAVIIGALSAFVVLQLRADLRATVDDELREYADRIERGFAAGGTGELQEVAGMVLPRDGGAQVLDAGGRVLLRTGKVAAGPPLVRVGGGATGSSGRRFLTIAAGRPPEHWRAMVAPLRSARATRLLVVAESLEEEEWAVRRLLVLVLLAGPAALAATTVAGWWLARKALLPVDRMAAKAEQIGIDRLHERIAVSHANDEIGHLAATLNAMLDRLERSVEEKRQLIADASHELRTPLAAIRSELDVTLMEDDLSPAARSALLSTREEIDEMSRTVDNLLTLAQVDEGRLELLVRRVRLDEACEAAARPLRPLALAKRVGLEVADEPCETEADPQRLHQALTNFIENAIKFSEPGGAVRVTTWDRDEEVGVTVTDDGPGIPAGARAHVFDRFYRGDRARGRHGGSGLGLAIAREIAAAHGGRVWVESEVGEGSAFSLALPKRPTGGPAHRAPGARSAGGVRP